MNVVLVKREQNFGSFLQQRGWLSWIAPLLAVVPLAEEVRYTLHITQDVLVTSRMCV